MGLISDSDDKTAVNLSLPERVVERLHYQAVYHDQKRVFADGNLPVSVSVGYDGDKLIDSEVELVENYVGFMFYDQVPKSYFNTTAG